MSNKHPKTKNFYSFHPYSSTGQMEALNEFDELYDPIFSLEEMFDRLFPHNNREDKEDAQ